MTDPLPPDRLLLIDTVPPDTRAAFRTLFDLDGRLAGIVRTTREPLIGQMRLAWWRDALIALDSRPAPAEPLLRAMQEEVLPLGLSGALLAGMTEGWEDILLADLQDEAALARHCDARGAGLFCAFGQLLGGDAPMLAAAGRGWAATDLAANLSDEKATAIAQRIAGDAWDQAFTATWPKALRPVGAFSLIVMLDGQSLPSTAKALRLMRFRLIGR